MHTNEKEKSGTCCQEGKREEAEQQTYENETKRSKNE